MRSLLVILSVVVLSGCATILNDDTQAINISSSNQDIKGTVDGVPFNGPGVVQVKRAKANKMITVETEGCQKQLALQSEVDPVFFINFLSGGTFGSTTDYSTEKMWEYQDQVVIPCK